MFDFDESSQLLKFWRARVVPHRFLFGSGRDGEGWSFCTSIFPHASSIQVERNIFNAFVRINVTNVALGAIRLIVLTFIVKG